ncbi:MAG TPA: response regulator [Methylomirabilota bacterium]|jgi:DNA-binding response OmpR family regulator|nr:response regulator [Methylomirabilota bacterium]
MAKILLAEDEKQIGDMVAFKLTNSGHQVLRARDGEEALTLATGERPDLVILDVMMPVLNGFEVLRRLKADPELSAIPVIMLTAKGRERDVLAGLSAGAVDYIVKPFSLKELTARIDAALRKV